MEESNLTPEEKSALDALPKTSPLPEGLEQRIVFQLESEGLIRKSTSMQRILPWAASIAASILFFFIGSSLAKNNFQEVQINPEQGYMLILHEDERFQPGDPMEMFQEYAAWMNTINEMGVKITGQELDNRATVLTTESIQTRGEETVKRTTGYFIIEAESEADALSIAKQNPHLKYGGTIELKPFIVRK